jgi:hypothetical protein
MNRRTTLVLAGVALSTLAATAAVAQERAGLPTSPFTYDALGATPSLRLFDRTPDVRVPHSAPAAGTAAESRARAEPVRTPVLTYDTLGATPSIRLKQPTAEAPAGKR